ncbi:MAG: hypothetical protein L0Z50_41535 [Verrucomicrobiales bacterium]|nr:hypothetical protein [Verrucomicrobiales bacterium]
MGFAYRDFVLVLNEVIEDAIPAPGSYPVTFYRRDTLIAEIASLGISAEKAKQILSGFTIRKTDMAIEGRELWKPKQTYRAYQRGFFEFPHRLGPHLIWSRTMASEAFSALTTGICFKRLPPEWDTPKTRAASVVLSHKASDWFEKLVMDFLSKREIEGRRFKGEVQGQGQSVAIPSDVGEIDFLGFFRAERLLVVVECKMVEDRTEAKFWRDDLAEFVTQKDSYAKKFLKKIGWVANHKDAIAYAFKSYQGGSCSVAPVMLTLNPHFVAQLVKGFPCVSLAEFLADFEAAKKWPYETLVSGPSIQ